MKTSGLNSFSALLLVAVFGGGAQTAAAVPAPVRTLAGAVTGLATGNIVILRNLNGSEVRVTRNGSFTFGSFVEGSSYEVTVKTHPSYPAGNCIVTGGAGTITDASITIDVSCTQLPQITSLQASARAYLGHSVMAFWDRPASMPAGAEFNLYVSTRRDCDFSQDTFTSCPAGKVQSFAPADLIRQFGGQRLKYGQDYFVQLETVFPNGAKGLSNLARARPNELAFNGEVRAITATPGGTIFLGGDFTSVGVATGSALPVNRFTGDPAILSFPAVAGTVNAMVDDGAGGWFLGGQFTQVGDLPHRNLTHILADGSVDTRWRMFPDGPVQALEHFGRALYVGGAFNSIGGVSARNVVGVLLLPGGESLASWTPNPNNTVRALKVFGNVLYMGGDFTAGTGGRPGFLAAFALGDQVPLSHQPLPFDMNLDGAVRVLAADRDQALYVGGSFKKFGDATRVNLAKLARVGSTLTLAGFSPNPGIADTTSSVNTLSITGNGSTIYIGGHFSTIVGQNAFGLRTNLAAVTSAGQLLNWEPNPDSTVEALVAEPDGSAVYVGGDFQRIGSGAGRRPYANFAKVGATDGATASRFYPTPEATVRALALLGDTLYAGGDFNFLVGTTCRHLASIAQDGSLGLWTPSVDGPVNALVFHNNRFLGPVVYVGGSFKYINAQTSPNLAAIDAGSEHVLDSDRFLGTTNGPVNALAVLESSEALYVGGSFTSIANSPANNLAKLFLFNGTINLDFKPQPTGPINVLVATTDAVHFTDVIYAGGSFSSIRKHSSTPSRVNLAKISADSGTALDEFVVNANGAVTTLALSSDSHAIYVGGNFDRINGTLIGTPGAGGLAAVEIDGSPLLTGCSTCFNPGPDGGTPQALATFPLGFGERVFAGGSFPNIGGGPISNFAALTGYSYGAPTGFSSGSFVFPNGPVSALAVAGNKVYVGGKFTGFYGSVNGGVAGAARGNFGVVDAATGELIN
jgi:hypothetical protein